MNDVSTFPSCQGKYFFRHPFPACLTWIVLLFAGPVPAQLLRNGHFTDGEQNWGHWTAVPDTVFFSVGNGAARISTRGSVTGTACFVQNLGYLPPSHRFEANADLDASLLKSGKAVLRIEFWRNGSSGPAETQNSEEVQPGERHRVGVNFSPPEGTDMVKITCFIIEGTGVLAIDNVECASLTAPILQPQGRSVVVAGETCELQARVLNVTRLRFSGMVSGELITATGERMPLFDQKIDLAAGDSRELTVTVPPLEEGARRLVWVLGEQQEERTLHVLPRLDEDFDRYGGWKELKGTVTGFFHTEKLGERWWIIDPDGQVFFSVGVNGVSEVGTSCPQIGFSRYGRSVSALYADPSEWAAVTLNRLRCWGFNTLGAWSRPSVTANGVMPYAPVLDIGRRATTQRMTQPRKGHSPWSWFPDVFDPSFEEGARREAARLAENRSDPYLLGYFLDNEFSWGGLWEAAFSSDSGSPCRNALITCTTNYFGENRTAFVAAFAAAGVEVRDFSDLATLASAPPAELAELREAWERTVAERYYSVCTGAIREADPNHMIISQRFAGHVPDWANGPSGRYCDIVCMNFYNEGIAYGVSHKLQDRFAELAGETDKPMLIGEWSFKALDSGLPCTRGAATPVQTQVDRSLGYASFLTTAAANPYIVGAHWFLYSDQPYEGRFDGENSNYGLVDLSDTPYPALTVTAAFINRLVPRIAAEARFASMPVEILDNGPSWVRMDSGPVVINAAESSGARLIAVDRVHKSVLAVGAGREISPGYGLPPLHTSLGAEAVSVGFMPDGNARLVCAGAEAIGIDKEPWLQTGTFRGAAGFLGHQAYFAFRAKPAAMENEVQSRPFLTMSPLWFPPHDAEIAVKLGIVNVTGISLDGPLNLELPEGWHIAGLPECIQIPAGGEVNLPVTLHVPENPIPFATVTILSPVVDCLVVRTGEPVEAACVPDGEKLVLGLVNRCDRAISGRLCLAGPAGEIGQVELLPGITVAVPVARGTEADDGRIRGNITVASGAEYGFTCRVYDLGGTLDTQGEWTVREGTLWENGAGRTGGGMHMIQQVQGSTGCASPTVDVHPGQNLVIRTAASWRNIIPGRGQPWFRGNAAVYFSDGDGNYLIHHDLFKVDGTGDWTVFCRSFTAPPRATQLRVEARLINCIGELFVDDIEVIDCSGSMIRRLINRSAVPGLP